LFVITIIILKFFFKLHLFFNFDIGLHMFLQLFHIFQLVIVISVLLLRQNSTLQPLSPSSLVLLKYVIIPIIIVHLYLLDSEKNVSYGWMNKRIYLAPQ